MKGIIISRISSGASFTFTSIVKTAPERKKLCWQEVGGLVGGRRQEVGGRRQEVGGRRLEVGGCCKRTGVKREERIGMRFIFYCSPPLLLVFRARYIRCADQGTRHKYTHTNLTTLTHKHTQPNIYLSIFCQNIEMNICHKF